MEHPGYKKAAELRDLKDGESVGVEVGFLPLLLHRRGDKVYATGVYCPHQDVALKPENCRGDTITCEAHGYRMDIKTGACLTDPELNYHVFPTVVEDGEVWVKVF